MTLIRTARNGCFQLISNSWGRYLCPTPDPEAVADVTKEQLEGFELHDDISRLPADLWQRWIQLCLHLTEQDKRNLEVSCRFLRKEGDPTQWRIAIPRQEVDGASVHAEDFDHSMDIATGEIIETWPPEGWLPCGSSHSHNSMSAFFSATDDKYELGDPGLHIVVGQLDPKERNYTLKASITAGRRRFIIDHNAVIDTTPIEHVTYHPDVLKQVTIYQPKVVTWTGTNGVFGSGFANPNAGNGYQRLPAGSGAYGDEVLDSWDPRQWYSHASTNGWHADQVDDVIWIAQDLITELIDAQNFRLLERLKADLTDLLSYEHTADELAQSDNTSTASH